MNDSKPKPGEGMVFQIVLQDGRAYAAPIGASLDVPEAWVRITSFKTLVKTLGGVEWVR